MPSQPVAEAPVRAPYRLPEEQPALYWLQHWRTIRGNWRTVAVAAAGAAAGLLLAAFQPRVYHARTTIEIQGIADGLKSTDGNPNADSEVSDMQTQIRIMLSDTLLDAVRARLVHASPKTLDTAAASLTVRADGPTRLIEISADSSDPRVAAEFVNTLAAEFIERHIESRWQDTERASAKLKSALEDTRAHLEQSEKTLQRYARLSGLVIAPDRNSVSEDKLRQLQEELSRAQGDRVAKQARYDAVARVDAADLPSILNNPSIATAQEKLTDLRRQIADLAPTYAASYPKTKRLEAQIAPLEAALRKEATNAAARIAADYGESRRREDLLVAAYRVQSGVVSADAEKTVHYDVLKREVDSTRTLYDTMLARVKESAIASAMRVSNVRVLDPARASTSRYHSRAGEFLLLGIAAGLFVGVILVVARDQTDLTIQAPGDLSFVLNVPELGAVPSRPGADAFRPILASLIFAAEARQSRVLVVTSASPAEGKTTIAAQLAGGFAETGKSVLLIDGDLRRPRLHEVFQTGAAPGFSELLASPQSLAGGEVQRLARPTTRPGLSFLPSGAPSAESPNLLYSARLREILTYARTNYDIVLIDTPPMLQIPDARVMGRAADSVLLVVRAGRTSREAAVAVRQKLLEDGTPVAGSVLNDWNPRKSPGYYGHYAGASLSPRRVPTRKIA